MKAKIYMAALAALSLAACSPEDFDSVSEGAIPVASEAKVSCAVDDETNTVTLTMGDAGQYVMWYIPVDGKEVTKNPVYSTKNPLTKIWTSAGDYTVYYRIGNKNGLSQGMGQVSFSIKNSLTNYDELYAKLCGKEWRMANSEAGHLGCGPSGTDGTEWWTAKADEKKAFGLYDDRLAFTKDGGTPTTRARAARSSSTRAAPSSRTTTAATTSWPPLRSRRRATPSPPRARAST